MDYNKIYEKIKENDRKSIYKAMNDICSFLIKNNINLFGISQLEYNVYGKLNFKRPITIITNKNNDFFLKFFKSLYEKYKKTKNKVFFSLPTKKRYHYIYQLNLHPVLIIYFSKPLSLLGSLKHLYYEYTLPCNSSKHWNDYVEIEDKFLKKHNTKDYNKLIKKKDSFKYIEHYNDLMKYFSNNKDIIITGKHAYDLVFNTLFFTGEPIEIIVSSNDMVEKISKDFNLKIEKIEKEEITYFYSYYNLFEGDELILKVFVYSRLINYVKFGHLMLSNIHGIFFHLLYDNDENIDYICHCFPKIDFSKKEHQIFQMEYPINFSKNILHSKVSSCFSVS